MVGAPELAEVISRSSFFADMGTDVVVQAAARMRTITVQGGERVLSEGDEPDGVYVLLRGRLRVTRPVSSGGIDRIDLVPGQAVGELGVLTGRARSADVDAVRDCEIAVLDRDAFDELFLTSATASLNLARHVARLHASDQRARVASPVSVVALVEDGSRDVDELARELVRRRPRTVVIDSDAHEGRSAAEVIGAADQPGALVLIPCRGLSSAWERDALRQADLVLVVTRPTGPVSPTVSAACSELAAAHAPPPIELVVLHPPGARPRGTAGRLDALRATRAHHLVDSGLSRLRSSGSGRSRRCRAVVGQQRRRGVDRRRGRHAMNTVEALRACSMFATAADRSIGALAGSACRRHGERGEILFVEGDPGRSMFVVVSGLVQLAVLGIDGRRLTLGHAASAACFGELGALDDGRRSTTATVLRSCELLEIPSEALRAALADDPALLASLLAQLAHLVRSGVGRSADLALADLERRVAKATLEAPAELTQQELAELAGGSRQMVNAVLAALCRRGLLELEGGRPRNLDRAGLERLADGLDGT